MQRLHSAAPDHDAERLVAGLAQHGGAGALGGHGGAGSSLGLEGADVQRGGVLTLAVGLPGVLWAEAGIATAAGGQHLCTSSHGNKSCTAIDAEQIATGCKLPIWL